MQKTQNVCKERTSFSGIIGLIFIIGCGPKPDSKIVNDDIQRLNNSNKIVQYQIDLDRCREEMKIHKSYELYEECAKVADKKVGRKQQ